VTLLRAETQHLVVSPHGRSYTLWKSMNNGRDKGIVDDSKKTKDVDKNELRQKEISRQRVPEERATQSVRDATETGASKVQQGAF
jgi:hypothetical protein